MKYLKILVAVAILSSANIVHSQTKISPLDLGLKINHGQIDKSRMTKNQQDTIVTGFLNLEDWFEDIVVYYKSRGEIKIFRNKGNGFAEEWRTIKTTGEDIQSIAATSLSLEDMEMNPNQRVGLVIALKDGTKRTIENRKIQNPDYVESKAPLRDFLDDPRTFLYDITFIEQWKSERSGQASWRLEVGDIDRDGKNEAIYTFWPLSGNNYPTRLVVFECVNQNQYRIDWDSTFAQGGCYNYNFPITDFDRDGNKEFFGRGRDPIFGNLMLGLYECYGEGQYKFIPGDFVYFAIPMEINLFDSVTINGITAPGMWICYSNWTSPYNTAFQKYRFKRKYSTQYQFDDAIPGDIQGGNWFTYSIAATDIDKDGKEEIVEGNTQWGSNYIDYWDSTGVSTNHGYELKSIIPNSPVSGGYLVGKDLDGDGYKEILACGIGYGTGSIGVVKHTGSPGQNQFAIMWWDTSGVLAMPNMGIDTGNIDSKYSILYPTYDIVGPNYMDRLFLLIYSRNGVYNFRQTCRMVRDSMAFIGAKLYDMDNDGKMNVITPLGINNLPNTYFYLMDWEQVGTIGITPISTNIPDGYKLFQNYPNPFNPTTKIKFEIAPSLSFPNGVGGDIVLLKVYDITGREIQTLVNETLKPGVYEKTFDGSRLSSGIYFYSLIVDGKNIAVKKMVMVK